MAELLSGDPAETRGALQQELYNLMGTPSQTPEQRSSRSMGALGSSLAGIATGQAPTFSKFLEGRRTADQTERDAQAANIVSIIDQMNKDRTAGVAAEKVSYEGEQDDLKQWTDFSSQYMSEDHNGIFNEIQKIVDTKYGGDDSTLTPVQKEAIMAQAAKNVGARPVELSTAVTGTLSVEPYKDRETGNNYMRVTHSKGGWHWEDSQGSRIYDKKLTDRLDRDVARETALGKTVGKGVGSAIVQTRDDAVGADRTLSVLSEFDAYSEGVTTGVITGSKIWTGFGNVINQMGKLIGKDWNALSVNNLESMRSAVVRFALFERKGMKGQGTISDNETAMIRDAGPKLTNTNQGNQLITYVMGARAKRRKEKWDAYQRDIALGITTPEDFYAWENTWMQENSEKFNNETREAIGNILEFGSEADIPEMTGTEAEQRAEWETKTPEEKAAYRKKYFE